MRFHCVTELAFASAGGAADARKPPSAPTTAPTATATNQTDRLRAIFSSCSPPLLAPFVSIDGCCGPNHVSNATCKVRRVSERRPTLPVGLLLHRADRLPGELRATSRCRLG